MSAFRLAPRPVNVCRCTSGRLRLFDPEAEVVTVLAERPKHAPSVRGEERRLVYRLAGGHCAYCDKAVAFADFEVDHQDPWARGGLHCRCNWAFACVPCNRTEGRRSVRPVADGDRVQPAVAEEAR